jgi:hypothetical protein
MPRTSESEIASPGHTVIDRKPAISAAQRMLTFHARLKERGLKSTGQRDDIARVFFDHGHHISAEELYAEVKKINLRAMRPDNRIRERGDRAHAEYRGARSGRDADAAQDGTVRSLLGMQSSATGHVAI